MQQSTTQQETSDLASLIFSDAATDTQTTDSGTTDAAVNWVALPFDQRQRSRLHTRVAGGPLAGQAVGIDLPRGTVLRDGLMLTAPNGSLMRIDAASEPVYEVTADTATNLMRLAYHLGNRHVPVQIDQDRLRFVADHVLADMVQGLGGNIRQVDAPFDPESGAYSHRHDHGHDDDHGHGHGHHHGAPVDRNHAPKIHDLSDGQ